MSLTFEQLVTLLTLIGGGVAAVWFFLTRVAAPAWIKRQEKFGAAVIEDKRDRREYEQKTHHLEQAYLLSESAVAQQRIAELLEQSQNFIQEDIKGLLDEICDAAKDIPKLRSEVERIKYDYRNLATQQKILVGLVSEMYDDFRKRAVERDGEK